MITHSSGRRGRPKGNKPPVSSAVRATKFRERLKETGGVIVTLTLDAHEVKQLEDIISQWNLPADISRSEALKAVILVQSGGTYFTRGHSITTRTVIEQRSMYPAWLDDSLSIQ